MALLPAHARRPALLRANLGRPIVCAPRKNAFCSVIGWNQSGNSATELVARIRALARRAARRSG
jgi:hypothetical protein